MYNIFFQYEVLIIFGIDILYITISLFYLFRIYVVLFVCYQLKCLVRYGIMINFLFINKIRFILIFDIPIFEFLQIFNFLGVFDIFIIIYIPVISLVVANR